MINRSKRIALAKETLAIVEAGEYWNASGQVVSIAQEMQAALRGTRLYRPSDFPDDLPLPPAENVVTWIEVTGESALEAARRLTAQNADGDPFCLNFASAKNPGGGFLNGSQAQEESLARSSGLYPCLLRMREMYDYHRSLDTCLYSDHMIYSPQVPVFRDDDGRLLDAPYRVSFLTSPAVNAGAVRRNEPEKIARIEPTLRTRMAKLLCVAARRGHDTLILGAWGCGVFDNDPAMVARLFAEQLAEGGRYHRRFRQIVFAVYDRSEDRACFRAFQNALQRLS